MDNLSHSVVGLAAGELIHRLLPAERQEQQRAVRRRMLLLACWMSSNFPDLDLLFTHLLPSPLGYLLHHRGHTHTLLYALPQAVLIWGLIYLPWPAARTLLKESRPARHGMALAVGGGLALHILMDYLNSYGVHPFHPLDSDWYYGDMVFIVEPLFWVACGIPLAMMVRLRWMKAALIALLFGALSAFAAKGLLSWMSLAVLTGLAALLAAVQRRAGERGLKGLLLSASVLAGFVGAQALASHQGRLLAMRKLHIMDPSSRLLDVAMTPFPSHPLCWNFVSVESSESLGTYRVRRGTLSLLPAYLPVQACPAGLLDRVPAPDADEDAAIFFSGSWSGSLALLRTLNEKNCFVRDWLRFARVPVVDQSQASDMRFSYIPGRNFTTLRLDELRGKACPEMVPDWGVPRRDLLAQSSAASSLSAAQERHR